MPGKNDQQYQDYMSEVQSYLKQVKNGRRVPAADPADPRFSQQADDERQARRAGYGDQIKYGPPTPVWQPQQISQQQPQQVPPPGGTPSPTSGIMDWLDQKRGQLTKLGSSGAAAPSPVWGFHEPTLNAAEGMGKAIAGMGDVMSDPRNAWMGMGPLAAVSRPAGWGAEVLRRYKLKGGTPETLNQTLKDRAMHPEHRQSIVNDFRQATDLAAPSEGAWFDHGVTTGEKQARSFEVGGSTYDAIGQGAREYMFKPYGGQFEGSRQPIGLGSILANPHTTNAGMESRTQGNAAYDAVSRQVGRMLDSPEYGFGQSKPNSSYWAQPGYASDAEYYREFPIDTRRR